MTIGQRIKARRQELGLTQTELSERMGYTSKSTISKAESKLSDNLTLSRIAEFAEALETNIPYLLGLTTNTESAQEMPKLDGADRHSSCEIPCSPAQNIPAHTESIEIILTEHDEKIGIVYENIVALEERLRMVENLIAKLFPQGWQEIRTQRGDSLIGTS